MLATLRGKPGMFVNDVRHYSESSMRGMSYWHDLVDWIGGYPFQVAKPEEVFKYFLVRGYQLENLRTCAGGIACNEFVFRKSIGE
jgi:2-polyprenyl-6-hydroxyphenyl methylase/3-demethylubiquinone-9 3-methyltransferase